MKLLMTHLFEKQYFPQECLDLCIKNKRTSVPTIRYQSSLLKMATEQGLYKQVATIRQKEYDNKREKENTKKYNS